jgi:NAD(P)-dependent dehydrogenase (short-subunit alcohol dehydrogenase family)
MTHTSSAPVLEFAGEVALVTGGAQGLGREIATALAARGASIVLADLDVDKLSAAAADLADQHGARVVTRRCDVGMDADWDEVVRSAVQTFGRLDHLVNNAGTLDIARIVDSSPDAFRRVVEVNVTGVYLGMRAVLPIMCEQRRGSIVNISSLAGKKGMVNLAGYCASKAAVISLTQTAALEAAPIVRVNAVCPGVINTEMQQREYRILSDMTGEAREAIEQRWLDDMPMKRFQEPSDIAAAVCFLSSERARQITGEALNVNGGLLMD